MDPKPLTKERRAEIEDVRDQYMPLAREFDDLFAAERFWREAVKNAKNYGRCSFCMKHTALEWEPEVHTIDCPTRFAKE